MASLAKLKQRCANRLYFISHFILIQVPSFLCIQQIPRYVLIMHSLGKFHLLIATIMESFALFLFQEKQTGISTFTLKHLIPPKINNMNIKLIINKKCPQLTSIQTLQKRIHRNIPYLPLIIQHLHSNLEKRNV